MITRITTEGSLAGLIFRSRRASWLIAVVVLTAVMGCGGRTSDTRDSTAADAPAATDPAPPDLAPPHADSILVALGNEPFWNVRVTGREILYTDPEHLDGIRFPPADAAEVGGERVFHTQREAAAGDTGARELELRLHREPCSDGMSDREYPMRAVLVLGGETRRGCAHLEPVAQVSEH